MFEIQEVSDEFLSEKWDSCVKKWHGSFLQSWDWGEFQKKLHKKIWRIIILDNKKNEYPFLIYREMLPGGFNWLYIPHIYTQDSGVLNVLLEYVNQLAKQERSLFVYTDPSFKNFDESVYRKYHYKRRKNASIQPLHTIILPLKDDAELLKNMHKKTRYNIRLAQKKGVTITHSKQTRYINAFWELTQKTQKRQGIDVHGRGYYEKLLQQDSVYLLSAIYKDQVIASNILILFGNMAVYLHGASDYTYRKLMAPYLLQWEGIQFAKKNKVLFYDFWGIQAQAKNTKNWGGITKFKKGFTQGQYCVEYQGLYIFIARRIWYYAYRVLRPLRKFLR